MRRLAICSVGFALATAFWQIIPAWYVFLIPLPLMGAAVGFLRERRQAVALILTVGFFFGALWTFGHDYVRIRPARQLDGQTREITVRVEEFPRDFTYSTEIRGRLLHEDEVNIPIVLRLPVTESELTPGDIISVTANLHRADRIRDEHVRWFFADGVFLRGFARDGYTLLASGSSARFFAQYLREGLIQNAQEVFPENTVGFVVGMLIGNVRLMCRLAYNDLRVSGIAHIVSVSGMHIAFLAGFLMLIFGKGRRGALIALSLIYVFVLVTGASPSTVRAAIMQTLLLTAPLLGRESDTPTSLGAALFFILLTNPNSIASISLQLSFLAVIGIMTASSRLYRYFMSLVRPRGKIGKRLARVVFSGLSTTLGALSVMAPALVFHFGLLSVYAPLTNLLTIGPATFVFLGGAVVSAVGAIWVPLAQILAYPVTLLVQYITWIARGIANLPMAALHTYSDYIRVWLVVVFGMTAFYLLYRREKPRPLLPVGLCAGLLIFVSLLGGLESGTGQMTVTTLDVGQGQSVVITTPDSTILVDNGGTGGARVGDIAAEYLFSRNIARIDFLVVTHFHADHVNGLERLMSRIEVERMLIPEEWNPPHERRRRILEFAEHAGTDIQVIRSDTVWQLDTMILTVFGPLSRTCENDSGISVLASADEFDVLITGDISKEMERRLIQLVDLPEIALLLVGHHGSRHSTAPEFLEATLPTVAVISVGADNPYGHPTPEAKLRLHRQGASIYRTDRSGHITVRVR